MDVLDTPFDNDFWEGFETFIKKNYRTHTAKCRLIHAKRYSNILIQGEARDLMVFSSDKRIHIMKALSALSKYSGYYERWKSIIKSHQLKWSSPDRDFVFQGIINREQEFDKMVKWFKMAYAELPENYGNILLYDILVGLRPREACQSISLLNEGRDSYLSRQSMTLEHFRFPEIFISRTKKAYISIVTDQILEIAKRSTSCSYNALRLVVQKKGLDMRMSFCRKIFATYLRNNGIEQEIIDLLQGRIPKSVFVRHYYRPNFNDNRIQECVNSLHNFLIQS